MKLQAYLDSVRETPFEWGSHDCALFAAKAIDETCGTSLCIRIKSLNCHSARDYRKMQRSGASLLALTIAEIGSPAITGSPRRGDVVLIRSINGQTLGIAAPPLVLVAGRDKMLALPISETCEFWRIT